LDRAVSKVTRKGQVTIPASLRERYRIAEGSYVRIRGEDQRLVLEPVPDLLDLVGVDAGKYDPAELKRKLDESRAKWR
jgi:AbrB family looped-hinge helix DNA binding protein